MSDIISSSTEIPVLNVTVNTNALAQVNITPGAGACGGPPEAASLNVTVNSTPSTINVIPGGGGEPGPQGPPGPMPTNYISSINGLTGAASIIAGSGISITTPSGYPVFTITNNGIRSIAQGLGIVVTGDPKTPVITNTGVISIRSGSAAVSGIVNLAAGSNIGITRSGQTFTISAQSGLLSSTGPANSGITKSSSFTTGTQGLARKVVVLAQDGSLTFDNIKNFDIFNPVDYNFSINSFTTTATQTSLIGATAFLFTGQSVSLAYGSIYPAIGVTLTIGGSGFGFPVNPASPYTNYNFTSLQGISYTIPPQSTTMTATATDGNTTSSSNLIFNFYNNIYYGVSSNTGLTGSGINSSLTPVVSNTISRTFSVISNAGQYIYYSYPSRLGSSATFFVGGFAGGFQSPYISGITNNNGYYENFYVFRSNNSNLGSVTVTVS